MLRNLDFGHKHVVSKVSRGKGLALLWKADFDLLVDTSSLNQIDAQINEGNDNTWRFTGFYGAPKTHNNHHISWSPLKKLTKLHHFHGCVRGTLMRF